MRRVLLSDRRGSVATVSAVVIAVLIGFAGLALEFGNGLLSKIEDQRVADYAAYAGATVYNSGASTSTASGVATHLAALNGISSGVNFAIVSSPTGDGNQAGQVTVTTNDSLALSRVLLPASAFQSGGRYANGLAVSATAYAEIGGAPGCIIALDHGGTGVTLSGGTSINAPNCAVASNNTVTAPCGTTIVATTVDYNSASAPTPCSNNIKNGSGNPAQIAKQAVTDPLAGNGGVSTATARLTTVANIVNPAGPTVPAGTDISFDYGGHGSTTASSLATAGCSGSLSSSTWTVTCTPGGTYNFGTITIQGGLTVNFNNSDTTGTTTYNFSGSITDGGTALAFGPGKFNIAGGINNNGGGSTMTFGAGTFRLGTMASCSTGAGTFSGYSICQNGTRLAIAGPSTFVMAGGIWNKGGETLTLGSGSTNNSFDIGKGSDGSSLQIGGGATTTFGDASGGGIFQMAGNIAANSGGSCLTISASPQHDINGFINDTGGITLGAGLYTVEGYVAFGVSNGGDVTCNGTSIGVVASGVTFVLGGAPTVSTSNGPAAFDVGAGFGHVTITAPTSGTTENLAVIGPVPANGTNTAIANFSNGATNTQITGAFYFPQGAIDESGAAGLTNTSGGCLELIGTQVTLSGGSNLGSSCGNIGGTNLATGKHVALVQ